MNLICNTNPAVPDLAEIGLAPVGRPMWLTTVLEGMRVQSKATTSDPPVRAKPVTIDNHRAFLIKNAGNRVRLILMSHGNVIKGYASTPGSIIQGSPYIPLYPEENDPRVEQTSWPVTEVGLMSLARYCTQQMERPTEWSADDHTRIPVSFVGIGGFLIGRIAEVKVTVKRSVPYWKIRIESDVGVPTTCEVRQDAIRYDAVHVGYYLIYKSPDEADIASVGEVQAFTYQVN